MVEDMIRKHAIFNAVKFGKAEAGRIVGKIIAEQPELSSKIRELMPTIVKIVEEVNGLCQEELERLASEQEVIEKPKRKEGLVELEGADNGVVMRFAPSPSGPMHLGHAITGGLTSLYVAKYGGKFILRIEDTNSEKIAEEAYKLLAEDAEFLFGNVTEVWIQSDRIKIYYDYVEKLLDKDAVYVCSCDPAVFKDLITAKTACPCRTLARDEQKNRWNKMLDGYKQGEAVLRFKSNIEDKNPAMRDFPLARINEAEHPRTGKNYRVWPLMNLSVTVDDIEGGMTHIIRAKDHADNAKRQEMIYKVLGANVPKTYFTGRYHFEGLDLSCSETRERILAGEFEGWDDIRLPFIQALKKRGYQAAAFLEYAKSVGLSKTDKRVDAKEFFKTLNALNKDLIDSSSKRLFFIKNPVQITVKNAPDQDITLDLHPEYQKGGRDFKTRSRFMVEKEDFEAFGDSMVRLMDCLNFTKVGEELVFDSVDYEVFKDNGKKIIHWLPYDQFIEITVKMPDGEEFKGIAEKTVSLVNIGDIVQFERFGFCCKVEKNLFWFGHR